MNVEHGVREVEKTLDLQKPAVKMQPYLKLKITKDTQNAKQISARPGPPQLTCGLPFLVRQLRIFRALFCSGARAEREEQ